METTNLKHLLMLFQCFLAHLQSISKQIVYFVVLEPKVKFFELLLRLALCLFLLLGINSFSNAQSSNESKTAENAKKELTEKQEKLLDTDETLLYVGEKMMYQLKKKFHLSDEQDEEEEKKRKEKAKNVKFSLFGITIEKG